MWGLIIRGFNDREREIICVRIQGQKRDNKTHHAVRKEAPR